MLPILFTKLSLEEKVDFFIKCQSILAKYHPDSPFLFTKDNFIQRKDFIFDFINKYKGFVYYDSNICILFNKIKIKDTLDKNQTIKENIYKEPKEDFNAYLIDFAAFNNIKNIITFVRAEYSPQIEWVAFVKKNKVQIYKTEKLLKTLNGPLI